MVIAWIVFLENVDRRFLLGAGAMLVAAVVFSCTGEGVSLDAGGLLVAGACLAWGIDNNLTRKLSAADPVHITILKGLVTGSVNVVLALVSGCVLPSPLQIALVGLLGFFAVGVSLLLFIRTLRHLGSARTGAYFSLAPSSGRCWRSVSSTRR